MSYSNRMQKNHVYSEFLCPRGRDRIYDLGIQIAQLYLSPFDRISKLRQKRPRQGYVPRS